MGSTPIGISASRSSTIMGINPWQSELEVWQNIIEEQYPGINKKLGYEMPVFEETAQIRWGLAFEDAVCKMTENIHVCVIEEREKLYKYNKYITCHIDGKFNKNNILYESKTTSFFYFKDNFGEPGTNKVPVQIQSQCQHQMLCTGAEKVILSVLVFPRRVDDWEEMGIFPEDDCLEFYSKEHKDERYLSYDSVKIINWARTLDQMGYFHQYEINANKETQETMLRYYKNWWKKHIKKKTPPDPKYYSDIKRIWKAPVGTIIADNQLERWCSEYKGIGKELGTSGFLSKRKNELKVLILKTMRKMDYEIDDESRDRTILRSQSGVKLISYTGKVFR